MKYNYAVDIKLLSTKNKQCIYTERCSTIPQTHISRKTMPMMYSPICAYKYQIGSILNESGDRMGDPHNLMGCYCRCLVLFCFGSFFRQKWGCREEENRLFFCLFTVGSTLTLPGLVSLHFKFIPFFCNQNKLDIINDCWTNRLIP